MASPTQWPGVWVKSGNWWWTGRPGVLQSMGSQRVRHDWATELNWTTLTVESEGEIKGLSIRVKDESAKRSLKLNIQKTKIMASSPITSWQIDGEKVETVADFILLGSKITVDSNCSQKTKRRLLLGRKAMTNLDSWLQFITKYRPLLTKVLIVKAMVFPIVTYGYESWNVKKAERWRIDAFQLWCWRRLFRHLGQQRDQTRQYERKSTLNIHWKDWRWSGSPNTLAT